MRPLTQNQPETIEIPIVAEDDVVRARSRGREICRSLGFTELNQVKVATAISELARNIFQYAGSGVVILRTLDKPRRGIEIVAKDAGAGIPDLKLVLSGSYKSKSGMGMGMLGTRRLMDQFEVETGPGKGTTITVRKFVR
jgi:serine/threonine-protein kinase RsbT